MAIFNFYKKTFVMRINSWQKFGKIVRSKGCNLLTRLDEFPNSILVTGCQRSGTTMLSRIITQSDGMVNYWFGKDDELDAALILSGYVEHMQRGRYCFQTTYLNECVDEYFQHNNSYKIIWVLRQPFSVIHSMLYNWKRFALNELFTSCGAELLGEADRHHYNRYGVWGISRLKRACMAYCGKVSQLFKLNQRLPENQLMVVSYDELVSKKEEILPKIYRFIELSYKNSYTNMIHKKSLSKHSSLSPKEHDIVEAICMPTYLSAKKLLA